MAGFEFREPNKPRATLLNEEYLQELDHKNFSKRTCVLTSYGLVIVSELYWETNSGQENFSHFQTFFNGLYCTAFYKQAKLSDIQMKGLATRFIKTVQNFNPTR